MAGSERWVSKIFSPRFFSRFLLSRDLIFSIENEVESVMAIRKPFS